MAGKRKRHRPHKSDEGSRKRVCYRTNRPTPIAASHPTLSLYYPQILTLRNFVLSRLPASSKSRRRRVAGIKEQISARHTGVASVGLRHQERPQSSEGSNEDEEENLLAKLLDSTLVCVRPREPQLAWQSREKDFQAFQQKNDGADESSLLEGNTSQSEVIHRIPTRSQFPSLGTYIVFPWMQSVHRGGISGPSQSCWLNAVSRSSTLQYGCSFIASTANPTVRCTCSVMVTSEEMYRCIMTIKEHSQVSQGSLYTIRTVMLGL